MSDAQLPRRSMSGVKVTLQPTGDGPGCAVLLWIDAAGAENRETYRGIFADDFATDLHAATLLGEAARHCYLLGHIRELQRRRPGGD